MGPKAIGSFAVHFKMQGGVRALAQLNFRVVDLPEVLSALRQRQGTLANPTIGPNRTFSCDRALGLWYRQQAFGFF